LAESKSQALSSAEKFALWEQARKFAGEKEQARFVEIMARCHDEGITIQNFTRLPLKGHTALVMRLPKPSIAVALFPVSGSVEEQRTWFTSLGRAIYHCTRLAQQVGDEASGAIDPRAEAEADYFARVLVLHIQLPVFPRLLASIPNAGLVRPGTEPWHLLENPIRLLQAIQALREKKVLLLGQYSSAGLSRLELVEEILSRKGMRPFIFQNLIGIEEVVDKKEVLEEVLATAVCSEMVIVEDSEASGHLLEVSTLADAKVRMAILRRERMGSTILMESLFKKYAAFMCPFEYNESNIDSVLDDIVSWFEAETEQTD